VIVGGFIGSGYGALKFDDDKIRLIVGVLVALAGTSLIIKML
jgi:uncharacterized membrane protein YfcA